jgi:hypothetical protein
MGGGRRLQKSWKESVMNCSNPDCNRGIGLVAHRRGWLSNAFVAVAPRGAVSTGRRNI